MGLFKRNPFGHILFVKKWLIRILGAMTHRRFRGFNELQIEGSEVIKNLPDTNVLFISNHQTYFADVVAMFHVFIDYPLEQVAMSGWREAAARRAQELPPLELNLLGRFQVRLFGQDLKLTDRQQQLILLPTLGFSREETAEIMWPEIPADKQRNNLGVQLNSLRKLIEPWGFKTYLTEHGLQNVCSDYEQLKRALAEGNASEALRLYAEPLAPGLTLELLENERQELRGAVVRLLFGAAAEGPPNEAVTLLTRVLELDPLHEEGLQQLLKHLLARGRRQEAVRRYQAFEQRLEAEMGLEPLAETTALLTLSA